MSPLEPQSSSGKILVVDDESLYAEMLYSILRQHHYAADMTNDPVRAREMILENDYSLLITDYQMPNMTGVQLVDSIRDAGLSLPVIIISGMMHTPELQRAVNMGITTVLQKPMATQNFLAHVNRYVPRPEPASVRSGHIKKGSRAPMHQQSRIGDTTTYPKVQHHVPGVSPRARRTLQRFWDQSKVTNQIFITCPKGGDILQHSKELAAWKGYGDLSLNFIRVENLAHPKTKEHFEQLTEDSSKNEVIVVDCRKEDLGHYAEALSQHVQTAEQYSTGSREIAFLYWLEDSGLQALKEHWSEEMYRYMRNGLVRVGCLCERLLDLASYSRELLDSFARRLKRPDRKELSPAAMHHLLQYQWPGNYSELGLVLWKAVTLSEQGPISAEEFLAALAASGRLAHFDDSLSPLESFLSVKQQIFITNTSNGSDDGECIGTPIDLKELGELMYPEIIDLEGSDAA